MTKTLASAMSLSAPLMRSESNPAAAARVGRSRSTDGSYLPVRVRDDWFELHHFAMKEKSTMRLPGFVAEASLLGIARSRDRRTAGGGARHFRQTPETITPQQGIRVDALHITGPILRTCRQRCEDDQQVARIKCLGDCKEFLGASSLWFLRTCTSNCGKGEDYSNSGKTLRGAPELKPGYCDMRCGLLGRLHIPPPHFVWP